MYTPIVAWYLYSPSKELVFLPAASTMADTYRESPLLLCNAQKPAVK